MEVKSPLSNFIDVLNHVIKTGRFHNSKLANSEASTRTALIEPVLTALGWDLTNPNMIELERVYLQSRIDYALCDSTGAVHTIIEAKKLTTNLNNPLHFTQMINYALQFAIQNVVLTDGIVWHHYTQFTPGHITPETIDLQNDPIVRCAEFFISKFDAYHYWPDPIMGNPPPPPPPPPPSNFVSLDNLPANVRGQNSPKQLRLPDGQIVQIQHWSSLLIECVNFVLKVNPLLTLPLPDQSGTATMLIEPGAPDHAGRYKATTYQGCTVYIYKNYSANRCVKNAKYILGFLPQGGNWQPAAVAY